MVRNICIKISSQILQLPAEMKISIYKLVLPTYILGFPASEHGEEHILAGMYQPKRFPTETDTVVTSTGGSQRDWRASREVCAVEGDGCIFKGRHWLDFGGLLSLRKRNEI